MFTISEERKIKQDSLGRQIYTRMQGYAIQSMQGSHTVNKYSRCRDWYSSTLKKYYSVGKSKVNSVDKTTSDIYYILSVFIVELECYFHTADTLMSEILILQEFKVSGIFVFSEDS